MSGSARKLSRAQEKERHRTQNGRCARCGQGVKVHPNGQCPDGLGSFTWAMTKDDMAATIERLEQAKASVGRVSLTPDEERVIELIGDRFMRGETDTRPSDVATALGMPPHYARALCDSLQKKGMLNRNAPEPS